MVNSLKSFLDSRGVTRYKFAKDTGIAQKTAYAIVDHPETIPNGATMNAICKAYKCQPGDFLAYVEEAQDP